MLTRVRSSQALSVAAYVGFVLIGLAGGGGGVLIAFQISDYGVDRTVFGLTFMGGAAGFALAGLAAGMIDHRLGRRGSIALGGTVMLLSGLATATRPPFWLFAVLTLASGFGTGVVESTLNTCLAELPGSATRLNRLHAFFGVGALIGPVAAERMLRVTDWTTVVLIVALLQIPVTALLLLTHPDETHARAERALAHEEAGTAGRPAAAAWSVSAVRWASLLLSVYVGLEMSAGNWGFSYLVEARDLRDDGASLTMSGFWLGLTVGRFVLRPLTDRLGISLRGLMSLCILGSTGATLLLTVAPWAWLVVVGMVVLGFLLGPVFPTAMATVPLAVPAALVPAGIGLMNAGSTVGGALLPWGAGAAGQHSQMRLLMPYLLVLALLQVLAWGRMAPKVHDAPEPVAAGV